MAAAYQGGESSANSSGEPQPVELPAEPATDASILEQVLAQTFGGNGGSGLATLRDAMRPWRGQAFSLSPVVDELVYASIRPAPSADLPENVLRAMAHQIAATLYDDPAARRRLEVIWGALSKPT